MKVAVTTVDSTFSTACLLSIVLTLISILVLKAGVVHYMETARGRPLTQQNAAEAKMVYLCGGMQSIIIWVY